MATKKHFLQDRTALLLVSGNAFLMVLLIILVVVKLNTVQGTSVYISSYRPRLGFGGYINGTVWDIISFIVFAVAVFATSITLSYRTYRIKRELSLTLLALTLPLLGFLIVVVNALLVLRSG